MKLAEIHRAWAPIDGAWTPWVKPVLFAALGDDDELTHALGDDGLPPLPPWFTPGVFGPLEEAGPAGEPYRDRRPLDDTAVVVDLPGRDGAELGVALVAYGFAPVPLYNAVPSPVAIVDMRPVMEVLAGRANVVRDAVKPGSPPAFLLDSNRMGHGRAVRVGLFDNRSLCRTSDFPSPERFAVAGIRRILLISEALEDDLAAVALAWQEAGLELWWHCPPRTERAARLQVARPWLGRRLWLRVFRLARRPRADGSYGVLIEPSAGG